MWPDNDYPTLHQYQNKLAFSFIENEWLKYEQEGVSTRKIKAEVEHKYDYAPPFAKRWKGNRWDCTSKSRYQ